MSVCRKNYSDHTIYDILHISHILEGIVQGASGSVRGPAMARQVDGHNMEVCIVKLHNNMYMIKQR